VIFGGNFLNVLGRISLSLFEQHGQVIVFKELPRRYLLEKILLPIIKPLYKERLDIIKLADIFLEVYQFIRETFPQSRPSPRNLQTMALRFFALQKYAAQFENTITDFLSPSRLFQRVQNSLSVNHQIAYFAAFEEIKNSLSSQQQKQFTEWMHKKIPVDRYKSELQKTIQQEFHSPEFILTKSREEPLRQLHEAFAIRELRIRNAEFPNHCGTRGMLLEGRTRTGKSLLAIEYLKSQDLQDGFNLPKENTKPSWQRFYHLTPADFDLLEEILYRAFHEGAVVVIDEINTAKDRRRLEKLLNAYLSGRDLAGQKATCEGFFIIASQNPITYKGRFSLSGPLRNRFQEITFSQYPDAEMVEILVKKGWESKAAEEAVRLKKPTDTLEDLLDIPMSKKVAFIL